MAGIFGGTTVPAAYQTLVKWAAGVIGVPAAVVAAQWNEESGFNPGAISPTGAEGIAQFEPGTWSELGCTGSPFDPSSASRCYAKYMYQLVHQFHGNVRDALAAYNAGPGDLAAGYGYADTILAAAGESQGLTGGGGSGDTGTNAPTSADLTAASQADCLAFLGGTIPIIPGVYSQTLGFCVLSKSQGRAFVAIGVMITGAALMGGGTALLALTFLRAANPLRSLSDAAAGLPGGASASEWLSNAQDRVTRTGAQTAAQRRAQRRTAGSGP